MEKKDDNQLAKQVEESAEVSEAAQSPLSHETSHSAQHHVAAQPSEPMPSSKPEAKHLLPRSPTPTMKTESVNTDSASKSASPSSAPSPSSPTIHASLLPPEAQAGLHQLLVALKILVSNSASGLIIGRSGSTISALQAKSMTRIKLSQGGDYYPGTSDRVCLIQGSLPNVSSAVEMVLAKLNKLQSFQNPSDSVPDETASSTSFIVRLLVPSTCCGMIIGRGGSNIKSLKEKSEVTYIQLSPKEHEIMHTSERIMTITGPNSASCVNCVRIIVNDMTQNPEISRYINMTTSYPKHLVTAPSPSSYAVATTPGVFLEHDPYQLQVIGQPQVFESPPRYSVAEQQFIPGGQFSPSAPVPGLQFPPEQHICLLSPQHQGSPTNYDAIGQDMSLPMIGDPSTMIQSQPYGMASPPRNADLSAGPSSSSYPQYHPSQVSQTMQFWSPDASTGLPGRNILSSGSGNLSSVDQLTQSFQTQATIQSHPSHSSLQHLAGPQPVTAQLGVPDTRIGSILGRGGKTLTEIQTRSHTKIRISQRGEFYSGTQNRIVYITGNTTQDVDHARQLVHERLASS